MFRYAIYKEFNDIFPPLQGDEKMEEKDNEMDFSEEIFDYSKMLQSEIKIYKNESDGLLLPLIKYMRYFLEAYDKKIENENKLKNISSKLSFNEEDDEVCEDLKCEKE